MKTKSILTNKIVTCIFAILLVALIGGIFISNKNSDKVTLDEVRLKDVKEGNSMFAIMVQQEGDTYIPYGEETWPTDGYTFNEDKSGCLDSEGKKIEGINLSFDETTKKVKVETDVTSYCYIYFDKKSSKAGDVIKDKVGKGGLIQTTDRTDLKYRYVGTADNQPENYICFGSQDCKANDSEFKYRIIGITEDGQLKLIKNKALSGTYGWHSGYEGNGNNAIWDSASGKIESELHQKLNGSTFLTNASTQYVPNGWEIKIADTSWYIGDSKTDSGNGFGTGKTETGSQVWAWESATAATTSSKIGLMYLSDYYYSLDGSGDLYCHNGGSSVYDQCKTSWLHISNNGDNSTPSNTEWTMSRYGQYSDGIYYAWLVTSNGQSTWFSLNSTYAVRPVLYLTVDSIIKDGSGTSDDPYILESPEETGTRLAKEKFGSVPQGFMTTPVADLYRFIGDNTATINNYICFGTTDNCYDNNSLKENYQYRIIGVDTSGRLKLIKDKALSPSIQWHNNYNDDAVWDVANNDKKEADLHKNLNSSTFLESETYVPASGNWKDKIDKTTWKIGDVNNDSYAKTGGDAISTQEQTASVTTPSEIGLMYLSDYYYSLDGKGTTNCRDGGDNTYAKCKTSWLHISNNGDNSTTSSYEWTMTRYGQHSSGTYHAWFVNTIGIVGWNTLTHTYAIRPAFYLKSDVKITGEGTKESPYIIN